jgi:hypothetical protein
MSINPTITNSTLNKAHIGPETSHTTPARSAPFLITPDTGPHYYGIYVRRIFFGIGLLMLFSLPFFSKEITVGAFVSMLGILVINLFAGMTNPRQKILIFFDIIISLIGTLFFELFAYFRYDTYGTALDPYFWFNEVIAIGFFIALYLSIKTFRGMVIKA